jgi:hypothetical protein
MEECMLCCICRDIIHDCVSVLPCLHSYCAGCYSGKSFSHPIVLTLCKAHSAHSCAIQTGSSARRSAHSVVSGVSPCPSTYFGHLRKLTVLCAQGGSGLAQPHDQGVLTRFFVFSRQHRPSLSRSLQNLIEAYLTKHPHKRRTDDEIKDLDSRNKLTDAEV